MDSDDENETDIDTALKSHTLLTVFHLYHPNIHSIIDQKVQFLLPPLLTTPIPIDQVGNLQNIPSVPENLTSDLHNTTDETHNMMEQELINEFLLLQKNNNINYLCNCNLILLRNILYIFYNMKYITHINIQYISEKTHHNNVKKWEKLQIYSRKQEILSEREKNSVFYIDSSSDDEGEYIGNNNSNRSSSSNIYINEYNHHNIVEEGEKGLNSHLYTTPHTTSNNNEKERNQERTPMQPAHSGHSKHRRQPLHRGRQAHPIKSIDAGAPSVYTPHTTSLHNDSSNSGTSNAGTTAMHTTTASSTSSSSRILSESKAPDGFNVTAWEIRLVCYDK